MTVVTEYSEPNNFRVPIIAGVKALLQSDDPIPAGRHRIDGWANTPHGVQHWLIPDVDLDTGEAREHGDYRVYQFVKVDQVPAPGGQVPPLPVPVVG